MSGRNRFDELTKDFTPSRRRRVDKIKTELRTELRLRELRQARALTQQQVAERLNVKQPAVAKLEHRTDVYLSSLRSYIEAVGGELRIMAVFPDSEFEITTFSGAGEFEKARGHPDPIDAPVTVSSTTAPAEQERQRDST